MQKELPDGYVRYVYGNLLEYDAMQTPRAILARAIQLGLGISVDCFVLLSLTLCKFLNKPSEILDCLCAALRRAPPRPDLLAMLRASPDIPELVKEFCREVQIVLAAPELFRPDFFSELRNGNAIMPFAVGIGANAQALLAIEELEVEKLTDGHLSSGLFEIVCPEAQTRALEWVLNRASGYWFGHAHSVPDWPFVRVLGRILQMGAKPPGELAKELAQSSNILRYLEQMRPEVRQCLCDELRKHFLHPAVRHEDLDDALIRVLVQNRSSIRAEMVSMMSLLFSCGASTLQRDNKGFLLITNVRGGVIFVTPDTDLRVRSFYHWMPNHRLGISSAAHETGEKLHFVSTDVQRDLIDVINSYGANWTRKNHLLFPGDFRRRIFTLLLINRRQRVQGMPWLPRDPLEIVIKMVATDDLCQEDQQILETRSLLATTYHAVTDRELLAMCRGVDSTRGVRRRRGQQQQQQTGCKTPFKRHCEAHGFTVRQKDLKRDFLVDFLVQNELGLLDDEEEENAIKLV